LDRFVCREKSGPFPLGGVVVYLGTGMRPRSLVNATEKTGAIAHTLAELVHSFACTPRNGLMTSPTPKHLGDERACLFAGLPILKESSVLPSNLRHLFHRLGMY